MHRNKSDGFEHLNARLYQNYGRPSNTTTPRDRRAVSAGAGASAKLTQQYQQLASGSSSRIQRGRPQPKQAPAAPQPWKAEQTRTRHVSPPRHQTPLSRNETPRSVMSVGGGNIREKLNNIMALASEIAETAEHDPREPPQSANNGLKAQEIERVVHQVQKHFADKISHMTESMKELQASRDDALRRLHHEQQQRLKVEEQGQLLAAEHERIVYNLEERAKRIQQQNRQLQELLHRKNSEGTSKEVLEPLDEDFRSDSPAVEDSQSWLHRPSFDDSEAAPMVEVEMSVQRVSEPVDTVGQLHRMTPTKAQQVRPQAVAVEEDDVEAFLEGISKDIADLELA